MIRNSKEIVSFTVVVGENDELTMLVKYIDENGVEQTISKKLASAGSEAAGEDTILPEADGSYTISGLELSENQEFNFDLHLQGTQHLEQGVYIYQAYGGTKASQTLVGIAEGTQDVSVTASMTVSFSVDEENKVVAKREWFEEADPTVTVIPPEEEEIPEEEEELPPPPVFEVNIEDDGAVVIEEEPVPLADAPKTGSDTFIWALVILTAAMGLAVVRAFGRKRRHETF